MFVQFDSFHIFDAIVFMLHHSRLLIWFSILSHPFYYFYLGKSNIEIPYLSLGVFYYSDRCRPTFINCRSFYHYVKTALYPIGLACDLAVNGASLVPSLKYDCQEAPFVLDAWLGSCTWARLSNQKIIRSQSGKSFYLVLLDCLITYTLKTEVVLVIFLFNIPFILPLNH